MANNRMILVNTATGQRVFVASHLATKWRALSGIEGKLDDAFAAELAEFPAAWGSTAWRVEYETDEPELDEELRRKVEAHAQPTHAVAPYSTPWYGMLQAYAAFCRSCSGDASRASFASAIDASLLAWLRGKEPSAVHCAIIEAWVMSGDLDALAVSALIALFAQIEAGGARAASTAVPPGRLDRLQRRILEVWAMEVIPSRAVLLVKASKGQALTADDRDFLEVEAYAVGEGLRKHALCRALEVCGGGKD